MNMLSQQTIDRQASQPSPAQALADLDQFASPEELSKAVREYLARDPMVRSLVVHLRTAVADVDWIELQVIPSHCKWGRARLLLTDFGVRISIPHLEGDNGVYKLTAKYLSLYEKCFDFRKLPELIERTWRSTLPARSSAQQLSPVSDLAVSKVTTRDKIDQLRYSLAENINVVGCSLACIGGVAGSILGYMEGIKHGLGSGVFNFIAGAVGGPIITYVALYVPLMCVAALLTMKVPKGK